MFFQRQGGHLEDHPSHHYLEAISKGFFNHAGLTMDHGSEPRLRVLGWSSKFLGWGWFSSLLGAVINFTCSQYNHQPMLELLKMTYNIFLQDNICQWLKTTTHLWPNLTTDEFQEPSFSTSQVICLYICSIFSDLPRDESPETCHSFRAALATEVKSAWQLLHFFVSARLLFVSLGKR